MAGRMYAQRYPAVGDNVMVKVTEVTEVGAYVELLEYNNLGGMVLLSELSRKRIRSINKLMSVGRHQVVTVLRVDESKGYVDLSKRQVTPDDIEKCEKKYKLSNHVHSVMRCVSSDTGESLEDLYEIFAWDLYERYDHAYVAFKRAASFPDEVLGQYDGLLREDVRSSLLKHIAKRFASMVVKIRATIKVACLGYEGIDAIKAALQAGKAVGTEAMPISIRVISSPLYMLTTETMDRAGGVALLNRACVEVDRVISTFDGGTSEVSFSARMVNKDDDTELAKKMAELARQNEEVDGDELDEGDF